MRRQAPAGHRCPLLEPIGKWGGAEPRQTLGLPALSRPKAVGRGLPQEHKNRGNARRTSRRQHLLFQLHFWRNPRSVRPQCDNADNADVTTFEDARREAARERLTECVRGRHSGPQLLRCSRNPRLQSDNAEVATLTT